ncbi:hypothetical protein RHS03_05797, partial [Rhizoctonia solani]
MVAKTCSSEGRGTSPRSTTENRPLSRNAQAQARLRARRKAHVESLEAEIKRLQTVVDTTALHPNRSFRSSRPVISPGSLGVFSSPIQSSSSGSEFGENSRSLDTIQQLRVDNDRLRRERDAFRVQVEALMGYVSRGCATPPMGLSPVSVNGAPDRESAALATGEAGRGYSSTPGSEVDSEDQQSQAHDPLSPLIPPSVYVMNEANHLISLYGSNLAFLRHLDLSTQDTDLHSIGEKPIRLPELPGLDPFGTT